MNVLLLAVLGLVILGFILLKRGKPGSTRTAKTSRGNRPRSSRERDQVRSPFAAVSITFAEDACSSVRDLDGRRFLEREAPITPLADCSCNKCQCRYIHYSDRRGPEDRRDPAGAGDRLSDFQGQLDRRSNRERRRDDSGENPTDAGYKSLLLAAIKEETEVGQTRP
jgi:hypothetical protein